MAKHSCIALSLLLMSPAVAYAQPDAQPGFGERDSFVLSVERSFGFVQQTLGEEDEDYTIESKGFFTPIWGDIGLFDVSDGVTWGALLGFTQVHQSGDGDALGGGDSNLYVIRLKPRVGFTFAKDDQLAAWLRVGPSLLLAHSSEEDSDDTTDYYFAASGEAYVVYTPVEHIGLVAGPVLDIHVFGRDEDDNKVSYGSFGLAAGMFGEF